MTCDDLTNRKELMEDENHPKHQKQPFWVDF